MDPIELQRVCEQMVEYYYYTMTTDVLCRGNFRMDVPKSVENKLTGLN